MKSEKLLFLIGEIDDKFIEEAAMPYKRKPHYIRYAALAASFLILVFVAVSAFGGGGIKTAFDSSFNGMGTAPETAYNDNHLVADSAATATSSDDADDEKTSDYGYGFLAVITSIDTETRTITVWFKEKNQFFEQTIEIDYDTIAEIIPFEELTVNQQVEVLVSVNETAEISSIR